MTLTETRPDEAPAAPPASSAATPPAGWLATADHKRLGLLYVAAALLFLLAGGALGVALRGELAETGNQLLGDELARVFSMHATITPLLALAPLWIGLATYLVPLQLGASRLALPRLHAFSFWLFLTGGGIVVAAYLLGPVELLGLASPTPFGGTELGAPTEAVLWVTGLMAVALATLLASVSLAVTVLTMRTAGMTMARTPLFAFASFVTSTALALATPVFLAGLTLLYLDLRYGGTFFSSDATQAVWRHTLWLYGRPELLLLVLPGLGAASDIVATHARRPLLLEPVARGAIALYGGLTFLVFATGTDVSDGIFLPTPTWFTALVAVPVGILALLWLGTLAFGRPRVHMSVAFVVGFLGLAALAAVNAAVAAFAAVAGGTAWTTAHVHVLVAGAPLLLAVAALYHWAPKMWGVPLSRALGGLVFLALFGGFAVNGLGTYLLGYDGARAHVAEYTDATQLSYSRVAAAGGVLVALGLVLLVVDLLRVASAGRSATGEADPYEGLTLEWAAASPPPPGNFAGVPEVRSAHPLLDLRAGGPA